MSELYRLLSRCQRPSSLWARAVLVTLVHKSGSSYRRPGARMLVWPDGSWDGMLSGGCIEDEVAKVASGVFEDGQPRRMSIDTDRWMGCQGKLELQMHLAGSLLQEVFELALLRTENLWLHTTVQSTTVEPFAIKDFAVGESEGSKPALCESTTRVSDRPQVLFSQPLLPPVRMIVVGAGPDCPDMLAVAQSLGWETQCIHHPEQRSLAVKSAVAMHPSSCAQEFRLDPRTGVIVMNHHFGRDAAYLEAFWPTPVGYLGLLGSQQRREQLLELLCSRGLDPSRLIFSPAGLSIGGDGPSAVALSVTAQMFQILEKSDL